MSVSIKDLIAARAAMSPGEWWVSDVDGSIGPIDWSQANIDGMLATHNLVDVIIECVRTELELRVAAKARAKASETWSQLLGLADLQSLAYQALTRAEGHFNNCLVARDAAWAKVSL